MTRTILVTGARGNTGREVIRQLAAHPHVVIKAGSSRPERLPAHGRNIHPVRFDWQDESTWPDAAAGIDPVYLMRPDLENAAELAAGLVGRVPDSHVVLLSEQSAEKAPEDSCARRFETIALGAAARWTNLRPSWFHQGLSDPRQFPPSIRDEHIIRMPFADAPIAWVDTRDIARVAVAALLDTDAHHGRHHTITGPQGLTLHDVADLLSTETGIAITAVDQPRAEALDGLPPWLTDILDSLYRRVRDGDFGVPSDTVESVGGIEPRSLQEYIRENRAAWRHDGPEAR